MTETVPSNLTSRLSKLNPFGKVKTDEDDLGETIDSTSVAGGGHASRRTELTRKELRVGNALKALLVQKKVLSPADAGLDTHDQPPALKALLDKPHVNVPSYIRDRSHPLPEYFISSSHNTYLTAHQLYGSSTAIAYQTALLNGARCVEIDAWDNDDNPEEPKVTHGYTLTSNLPFRAICETIRDVVDREAAGNLGEGIHAAPIMLSLENHCGTKGQLRLAQIMQEVWGDRLLSKAVREHGHHEQEGTGSHITLQELGNKIAVMVEYHFVGEPEDSDSSDDEGADEASKAEKKAYQDKKKKAAASPIIPELADLGVYAQSVKPVDQSWLTGNLCNGPHHHLINMSESGVSKLLPENTAAISKHNAHHLMRVYPKGTRIFSRNLNPCTFWGVGAQVAALNWQTFDAAMQLNEVSAMYKSYKDESKTDNYTGTVRRLRWLCSETRRFPRRWQRQAQHRAPKAPPPSRRRRHPRTYSRGLCHGRDEAIRHLHAHPP
jgi:phosphatidylinositol phospholipase C delta